MSVSLPPPHSEHPTRYMTLEDGKVVAKTDWWTRAVNFLEEGYSCWNNYDIEVVVLDPSGEYFAHDDTQKADPYKWQMAVAFLLYRSMKFFFKSPTHKMKDVVLLSKEEINQGIQKVVDIKIFSIGIKQADGKNKAWLCNKITDLSELRGENSQKVLTVFKNLIISPGQNNLIINYILDAAIKSIKSNYGDQCIEKVDQFLLGCFKDAEHDHTKERVLSTKERVISLILPRVGKGGRMNFLLQCLNASEPSQTIVFKQVKNPYTFRRLIQEVSLEKGEQAMVSMVFRAIKDIENVEEQTINLGVMLEELLKFKDKKVMMDYLLQCLDVSELSQKLVFNHIDFSVFKELIQEVSLKKGKQVMVSMVFKAIKSREDEVEEEVEEKLGIMLGEIGGSEDPLLLFRHIINIICKNPDIKRRDWINRIVLEKAIEYLENSKDESKNDVLVEWFKDLPSELKTNLLEYVCNKVNHSYDKQEKVNFILTLLTSSPTKEVRELIVETVTRLGNGREILKGVLAIEGKENELSKEIACAVLLLIRMDHVQKSKQTEMEEVLNMVQGDPKAFIYCIGACFEQEVLHFGTDDATLLWLFDTGLQRIYGNTILTLAFLNQCEVAITQGKNQEFMKKLLNNIRSQKKDILNNEIEPVINNLNKKNIQGVKKSITSIVLKGMFMVVYDLLDERLKEKLGFIKPMEAMIGGIIALDHPKEEGEPSQLAALDFIFNKRDGVFLVGYFATRLKYKNLGVYQGKDWGIGEREKEHVRNYQSREIIKHATSLDPQARFKFLKWAWETTARKQ